MTRETCSSRLTAAPSRPQYAHIVRVLASFRLEHDLEGALAFLERCIAFGGERLPRLIVTDLKLTAGSGLDLVRCLRTDPRLASVPVVILSSSDSPQDIRASRSG